MSVGRNVPGKFGIVFCKLDNYHSKEKIRQDCPRSEIKFVHEGIPGIDQGAMQIPYTDECIDIDYSVVKNYQITYFRWSGSAPIGHIICENEMWHTKFNDIYI